ncbi:hypothetical protein AWM75_01185 [Aerococcus urinaehominis]|uniref:Global transcriptional regulator CodY n=1 Tax=Aerococcus urinaehominis TaxID=128944 RepID=A0A0X8FJX9_9LACT|nr:GTP-sensing pleiotropic transcriptional regulator CodY [Aerococcus urinaehominis]AMB98690.1 hypothetical protein AWM75_01185 [Aerococcus urinaehominis]SDL98790.1 transcriptional pleiotropic repressor [Aerococcus urinaehominis]
MEELLGKIREIKAFMQHSDIVDQADDLSFEPMVKELAEKVQANAYLLQADGKILGFHLPYEAAHSARITEMMAARKVPKAYMDNLNNLDETLANVPISDDRTMFPIEYRDEFPDGKTAIVPIQSSGEVIGYLMLTRLNGPFNTADMILAEYIATVIAIEMEHVQNESKQKIIRQQNLVDMAVHSLSYSELEALNVIFDRQPAESFRITASKIAEQKNITRSVIVNALRKLESAGVIRSRSLGMKGTFIDVKSVENFKMLKATLQKVSL